MHSILFLLFSYGIYINAFNFPFGPTDHAKPLRNHATPTINNFARFPRIDANNVEGHLTWYPIGFPHDFTNSPKRTTIRDKNYIVWKQGNDYYALKDACSHQGASFLSAKTYYNKITCPYHGYDFNGECGTLLEIPCLPFIRSKIYNIEAFKVAQKGGIVYLNTIPIATPEEKDTIDPYLIFVEPEFFDKSQRAITISEQFEHNAKFVSVNSLDICHIGFVHSFGNRNNPNPISTSSVTKMDDLREHYKIAYQYIAGVNSIVNKIYQFTKITVENEYILPHSTVARVKFGNMSSTIITHALPISLFKTRLFVKAYRNYGYYDLTNEIRNPFYPFLYILNYLGDLFTYNTMYNTLKEDKFIVDNIDKTSYQGMHGKFSVLYDLFSNHYKNNYMKFYESE